jgi:hypothetical protein
MTTTYNLKNVTSNNGYVYTVKGEGKDVRKNIGRFHGIVVNDIRSLKNENDLEFSVCLENKSQDKKEYTEEVMTNAIDTMRKDFGAFFVKLNKLLVDCGAIIAGSYILQALNQEKHEDSDIDIFCPSDKSKTLLREICGEGVSYYNYSYYKQLPFIDNVINVPFKGKKLQIISVSCPLEQFIETFDMSFCKASWDGKTLNPSNRSEMEDILNKNGKYNKDVDLHPIRIRKYLERGYTISFEKC